MNLNLINDLLDLAKIEHSKFSLNQEYFSIEQLIKLTFSNMKFQADRKNIKLSLEFEEQGYLNSTNQVLSSPHQKSQWKNRKIFGDQRRYSQILLNFISNALKFTTNDGSIKLKLEILEL